ELLAVGTFVANDFGPVNQRRVVDAQGSAFATDIVLSLVKTVATKSTKCTQRPSFVCGIDTLCRVFDYSQAVALSNGDNSIHCASHAGVMDRNDCLRFSSNRVLNRGVVDI